MTSRVTADDLELAATWLETYDSSEESGEPDDTAQTMYRVAAWLRAEAKRRQRESVVRKLQQRFPDATNAQVRAALRKER